MVSFLLQSLNIGTGGGVAFFVAVTAASLYGAANTQEVRSLIFLFLLQTSQPCVKSEIHFSLYSSRLCKEDGVCARSSDHFIKCLLLKSLKFGTQTLWEWNEPFSVSKMFAQHLSLASGGSTLKGWFGCLKGQSQHLPGLDTLSFVGSATR